MCVSIASARAAVRSRRIIVCAATAGAAAASAAPPSKAGKAGFFSDQRFDGLDLSEPTRKALSDASFEYMTKIQAQAIPLVLQGRDLVAIAQTGSGKTLAFLIPAFVHVEAAAPLGRGALRGPIALVLAPTRELAVQIADEAKKLARGLGNAVTPGIDNVSARALVHKAGDRAALEALAKDHGLAFAWDDGVALEDNAEALLQAGYDATVELVTIEDLQEEALACSREIWADYPESRIRYKAIGGGGGKGSQPVIHFHLPFQPGDLSPRWADR